MAADRYLPFTAAAWEGAAGGLVLCGLIWLLIDALPSEARKVTRTETEDLSLSRYADTQPMESTFSDFGGSESRITSVPRRRHPHEEITAAVETLRRAVHERESALPSLGHKAGQDPLTRLADRASLLALSDWLDEQGALPDVELCLLCVELKGLEPVKARYGAIACDHVLQRVTKRLRDVSREEDFLFRLSSDEFLLMLPSPTGQGAAVARSVGKRVMSSMHRPLPYLTVSNLAVTCSVGSAIWPADGRRLGDVMRFADAALADSRETGRGGFKQYGAQNADTVSSP